MLKRLLALGLLASTSPSWGAIAFETCTYTSSAAGNDLVVTAPANINDGDLLLGFYAGQDELLTPIAISGTAGAFTQILEEEELTGNDISMDISYRVAASETGNYTFDVDESAGSLDVIAIVCVISGVNTSTPIDVTYATVTHFVKSVDDTTPTPQPITTVTDGAMAIVFAGFRPVSSSSIDAIAPSTGWTEMFDDGTHRAETIVMEGYVQYLIQGTAGTVTPDALTVTDMGATDDVGLATIALRPLDPPAFDTNPSLTSCTATGCTFGYDGGAVADEIHAMFNDTATAPPTCAQIEAETGSHGANGEAVTGSTDSITITSTDAPEFPLYDAHFCLEDGTSNYSSVVTVQDAAISDPTGEQFILITSIGSGSIVEAFNTAVNPDIASGDYLLANDNTDPGITGTHNGADNAAALTRSQAAWVVNQFAGLSIANSTDGSSCTIASNTATTVTCTLSGGTQNDWDINDAFVITTPATITAAGQVSYESDGTRQSITNIEVYDLSAGAFHASDIDAWFNNAAPTCTPFADFIVLNKDEAVSFSLNEECSDGDEDVLAYTTTTGTLPTGTSLGGTGNSVWSGTPTVENEAGVSIVWTATDAASATDTLAASVYVIDTWTMPTITGDTVAEAIVELNTAAPWYNGVAVSSSGACSASVALNDIISQDPLATAEVDNPLAPISVVVSIGETTPGCLGLQGIRTGVKLKGVSLGL